MIGAVKVGGILVEQGGPQTLLVGLGLNLRNEPWRMDPALHGLAGRLADCGVMLPEPRALVTTLLQAIRAAQEEFQAVRLAGLAPRLEPCWAGARAVRLAPAAGVTLAAEGGRFLGIDADGALRLATDPGGEIAVPAHHVGRLTETGSD
jgi:biotin-(acetyl-CoA carboxylase) ligase